jgi:hypothetical protein
VSAWPGSGAADHRAPIQCGHGVVFGAGGGEVQSEVADGVVEPAVWGVGDPHAQDDPIVGVSDKPSPSLVGGDRHAHDAAPARVYVCSGENEPAGSGLKHHGRRSEVVIPSGREYVQAPGASDPDREGGRAIRLGPDP